LSLTFTHFSFWFVSIDRTLEGEFWTDLVLGVIGVGVLVYHGFRDFSIFFPVNYKMNVYFSTESIEEVLNEFTRSEREDLNLKEPWYIEKQKILKCWNDKLNTVRGFQLIEKTTGVGDMTFESRRIEKNWQTYRIEKASGSITFKVIDENGTHTAWSTFELLDTASNTLRFRFLDAYINSARILRPRFVQWLYTSHADERRRLDDVTAVTKIRFFPFIKIEGTMYLVQLPPCLADSNESGKIVNYYVPVAYAIYDT
jgi:hypothetical protein